MLTPEQNREIDELLVAGRKIEAVKRCRELAGCDLAEAKRYVESRPVALAAPASASGCGSKTTLVLVLAAIAIAGGWYLRQTALDAPATQPAPAPERP